MNFYFTITGHAMFEYNIHINTKVPLNVCDNPYKHYPSKELNPKERFPSSPNIQYNLSN